MTLCLHAGAKAVTYDELRAVQTPASTDTHLPVPHHEIVELMRFTLQFQPTHLAGKDFPVSLGGVTKTWDVSKQVLSNLSALGIEHLIAIGGDDTLGYAAKLNDLGVDLTNAPERSVRVRHRRLCHN
jgi:hypothetical protein